MNRHTYRLVSGGLFGLAALVVACSQASPTQPTAATSVPVASSAAVQTDATTPSSDGDGTTGVLEILNVRLKGDMGLSQMAAAGGTYQVARGETVELWVTRPENSRAHKVIVDWGAGELDSPDHASCGPCILYHKYPNSGRFTVTIRLKDSKTPTADEVTRTFIFDVVEPPSAPPTCVDDRCLITIRLFALGTKGDCSLKEIDGEKASGSGAPADFVANGKDGKCKAKVGDVADVTCSFTWPLGEDLNTEFDLSKDFVSLICPGGTVTPDGNKSYCDIEPVTKDVTITGTCSKS